MKRVLFLFLLLASLLAVPALAAEPIPEEPPAQLPDLLVELFGEYQPRTYTVTEIQEDGSTVITEHIVPGLAGLDYEWLASVGIFALVIFCIFKLIGGVFKL